MRIPLITLVILIISGCSIQTHQSSRKAAPMHNASGSISWSSGLTEEFSMPNSRRTITFKTNDGVVIYTRAKSSKYNPCDLYYHENVKILVCEDEEATLLIDGKRTNTGFFNLYE